MSHEYPRECKNCGKPVLYWNDKNKGGRPFDVTVDGLYPWHQCTEWKPAWKPSKPNVYTPQLRECKFGCGTDIIYNTAKGFFEEEELNSGIEHKCPKHPQGYEYDENGEKHQEKQTDHSPYVKPQVKEVIMTGQARLDKPQQQPARQLEDLIREQNLILQGIAAQLQKMLDTLEISAKYQRASKDILQEYKDEVIDTINRKPPVSFESGRLVDDDGETDDIYDEISDTDDKTDSGVVGDLGGFKPTDAGSKGVRNDI